MEVDLEFNQLIHGKLQKNLDFLKKVFHHCSDYICKDFMVAGSKAYLLYIDSLIDKNSIQFHDLQQLLIKGEWAQISMRMLEERILSLLPGKETQKLGEVVQHLLDGNTILLVEGINKALVFEAKGNELRAITEPETEAFIRGPREGFVESIGVNMTLIRRKIRSHKLKFLSKKVGTETKTSLVIVYMEGLASPDLLQEVNDRIDRIEIDGVLESGYIEELIEDNPWSPFAQTQVTERPDTVAGNLLEGRVAILVDGTPFVLIVPATFWQLLQSSEDYYVRFHVAIFIRSIRFLLVLVALLLPSMYIAVSTFQQEMIPTSLLLTLAASREAIPFPAFVEALIMEISFEALREAGLRSPRLMSQTVSILGALIIGTAAVQAGIVSAPMVIIVSITGIASAGIPRFNISNTIRLLRFPIMILAATLGMVGIMVGLVVITAHMCSLRSFGVPYLAPIAPITWNEWKDVLIMRVPWWFMRSRPGHIVKRNVKRESSDLYPSPKRRNR